MKANDVPAQKLINAAAKALEVYKEIQPPLWSKFTKTGVCSERPPIQDNFWYIRCASILRKLYNNSGVPIGVRRMQTIYGKRRRRGHKPPHHMKAGGKIIRLMLQQLEKIGFIAKVEKPRKGRIITPKGIRFLDKIANKIGAQNG